MWAIIALVSAGVFALVAMFLALWLVITVLNFRDSRKHTFAVNSHIKFSDSAPDLRDHSVKIMKNQDGYLIKFIEYDDDLVEVTAHVITLERLDPPSFE